MKIFLEITFIEEIREVARWCILSGVTTNPALLSKIAGKSSEESIREIAEIVNGDMSAKTVSLDTAGMLEETRRSAAWHPSVVAKVPFTPNGWAAIKQLKQEASAPTSPFVSPLLRRCLPSSPEHISSARLWGGWMILPKRVCRSSAIPWRSTVSIAWQPLSWQPAFGIPAEAAKAGAYITTVPFKVLEQAIKHPLTDHGTELFLRDWRL